MGTLIDRAGRVLLLRKCGDGGEAHGGFRWPLTVGAEVVAPDWNPNPVCGGGLHGLPWGYGDWGLLAGTRWLVVSADPADVVDIDGHKSKARAARVEHIGTQETCVQFLAEAADLRVARGAVDGQLLPGQLLPGYGSSDGDGYGSSDGDGYGDGYGYGYGDGDGSGYGDGSGSGYGYGYGYGDGYGYGYGEDVVQ
jgi:hypothetical protein